MAYAYASNIRDVLVTDLTQFQEDDSGSNLGVGFTGWDDAYRYSLVNSLDYFGSIFPAMGDEETPKAFGYGMWRWSYYIRLHVRFEVEAVPSPDERIADLADAVFAAMIDVDNMNAIAPGGMVKVLAANYLGEPEKIEEVTYLTLEFLVSVKSQIAR